MCTSKKNCPVPFDQQPLNEYVSLKKSCFFSWSLLAIDKYFNTIFSVFFVLFVLLIPFISSILNTKKNFIAVFLLDMNTVTFIFICIFVRLYLGWSYVIKRLTSATVFYEESGWYDGQIWIKTVDSLMKDRLVGLYQIIPFLKRIQYSLAIFVSLFFVENWLYHLL